VNPVLQFSNVPPQILSFSRMPTIAATAVQMLMTIYCIKALLDQLIPWLTDWGVPFTL
jgi:hypothetical protein